MSNPPLALDVERYLAHHLAHSLNNALGAIGVFGEMMAEDVADPKLRGRLEKMIFAAELARGEVNALRYAVPRYNEPSDVTSFSVALSFVKTMLGEMLPRLLVDETADVPTDLIGPQSVLVYILYTVLSHVLGASLEQVTIDLDIDDEYGLAVIRVLTPASVNPLTPDQSFFEKLFPAYNAKLATVLDEEGQHGFMIFWPVPVSAI